MADMTAITALGAARSRPECGLCGRQRARARPAGAAQDGKHQRKWEARRRARTAEQPPAAASGSSKNRQPQLLVCIQVMDEGRGGVHAASRYGRRPGVFQVLRHSQKEAIIREKGKRSSHSNASPKRT